MIETKWAKNYNEIRSPDWVGHGTTICAGRNYFINTIVTLIGAIGDICTGRFEFAVQRVQNVGAGPKVDAQTRLLMYYTIIILLLTRVYISPSDTVRTDVIVG